MLSCVPMTWTAIAVTVPAAAAEAVASFLMDQGAPGLVTEEMQGSVRLTAHFAGEAPLAEVRGFCVRLDELVPGTGSASIESRIVTEEAWAENWKRHFPPIAIGERLFVHPPWVREVPDGRVGVEIDPGMAFGTGQHATTRGCLILLERLLPGGPDVTVLDLGTGSGILAIAAARLGASRVWAVDVDPEACRTARENTKVNGVEALVHVCDSLEVVRERCDVLLANLFATQLVDLAPALAERLRPGGILIGSGLLNSEEESVAGTWTHVGATPLARHEEEGWVTLAWRSGGTAG